MLNFIRMIKPWIDTTAQPY